MFANKEKEWIEQAMKGDGEAFGQLVQSHMARIFNVCLGLLGNRDDAEDCTQETFLKAYRSLSLYQGRSSFYTWIYRIAVNVCHDLQRSKKSHPTTSIDQENEEGDRLFQLPDKSPLPDEQAINHELGRTLLYQISQLRPAMREVLILRDLQGLSYEEIAARLDLSEGTVKSRLFRARNQVMSSLEAQSGPSFGQPEQIHAFSRPKRGREV
ncbi:MAG: sigma-70 family RNA polymerase sigma factor [Clostridia bacterium]|nr:sigma-70 family RNA polymerase sigma factor [Clostridia bacterium]NCC76370.1 sigma-70 family RNA polymerase sigma factor [Clostridia bacterium]